MGSKVRPKRPIFIAIFSCYCPASFVVAGRCCKSCYRTHYELCSLIAFLYQRVLRKASYETTLWTRLLLLSLRCLPGCAWQVYLWPLCRQETAVDCSNSLSARSAHSINPSE